jgi:hypothetical protein
MGAKTPAAISSSSPPLWRLAAPNRDEERTAGQKGEDAKRRHRLPLPRVGVVPPGADAVGAAGIVALEGQAPKERCEHREAAQNQPVSASTSARTRTRESSRLRFETLVDPEKSDTWAGRLPKTLPGKRCVISIASPRLC